MPENITMNAVRYKEVLEGNLLYFMEFHGSRTFMQYVAPCHKAKLVMEWLKSKIINVLSWSGISPNLNSIKNMWSLLKNKLQHTDTSLPILKEAIQKMWCMDISQDMCEKIKFDAKTDWNDTDNQARPWPSHNKVLNKVCNKQIFSFIPIIFE